MIGKFGPLLRRNLLRNPRRSVLTLLSLAASIFLVVILEGLLRHLDDLPRADGSERRLIVRRSTSFLEPLPASFGPKIEALSGVQGNCAIVFYLGIYKEMKPEYFFPKWALDAENLRSNYPETRVVDPATGNDRSDLFDQFKSDRQGASAGIALYQKYGWKLGDTLQFQGVGFPDVEVHLRSCYDGPERGSLFFHRDYLDELQGNVGRVSFFNVICKTPADLPRVAIAVDAMFANSEAPTITETEKSFQAGFVQMLGNVRMLLRSIALACSFAMLCVAANTLAMTARERAHEIAVMKTLGFSPARVLALLLVEVTALCVIAAILGAGAAKLMFSINGPWHDLGSGFLRGFRLPTWLALAALPLGALVGWIASVIPFVRVAYAPIAPALRRAG